ncbi:hypothetical protein [Actinokineospora pegani]|uniref:hypothetical protein n=1 Tax=Actinokineospora pegani TaxID=2654637 RepID=UPI0012EA1C89|nr:hypothetical protein [Actinokineospora pegani]
MIVEELVRTAIRAIGEKVNVFLQISTPPSILRVRLTDEEFERVYEEVDLLECLKSARRDLEAMGLLLCCQGARLNVFPSGMTRQMTEGRLAYSLEAGKELSDDDLVDIFAPADCSEVATLEDQLAAMRELFRMKRS